MIIDTTKNYVDWGNTSDLLAMAGNLYSAFRDETQDMTGWANLPCDFDETLLQDIERTAAQIREQCNRMIVIGIGGSYLGAKAVYDALGGNKDGYPELYFAGYNLNAASLNRVVKKLESQDTCLCVISKSGNTVETSLVYSILKERMILKYGEEETAKRIYAITDANKGRLHDEAIRSGYKMFAVPESVGGRYSVLSVVGLLPIAVAGHNIRELLKGAAALANSNEWNSELLHYAVSRNCLAKEGKVLEIFECFEENLQNFAEWLKQLFGESEGKDGKGVYPGSMFFTRDLHSMGQFLQQGNQIFFETMICVKNANIDFVIPEDVGAPYAGKSLEQVNRCAEDAVVLAHSKAGIPIHRIEIDALDEYNLGELIYFFEMSCAISASLFEVNPFDQPGVEDYKREMRQLSSL